MSQGTTRCGLVLAALLLAGCLAAPSAPLQLGDTVIETDTVWQHQVRIAGVVTVKKHGRLTIQPGTRVVFERFDRDGDGIGDGELLVEGELIARGSPEAPIVFTSGAAQPAKADWKYLYLDFARRAELHQVIAEYAYSGVQVHFCRASITDSVFRHNVDGVRFSTVNLKLAGNRIYANTHGLRYEERRSIAAIHHNDIRGNDIGIFAVTRSEDRAVIEQNNIVANRRYSVKLGLEQRHDITLPRNWWGEDLTILDARIDPALGRVHTPEPLAQPVDIRQWPSWQKGTTP